VGYPFLAHQRATPAGMCPGQGRAASEHRHSEQLGIKPGQQRYLPRVCLTLEQIRSAVSRLPGHAQVPSTLPNCAS
jgi:hypothetical protein